MTSSVSRILLVCVFLVASAFAVAQAGAGAPHAPTLPPGKTADDVRKAMRPAAEDAAQFIINKKKANPAGLPQVNLLMVELDYFEQTIGSGSGTSQLRAFYTAAAETARTDKQIGASSSSKAGATSVVDKPGIATLLGIAIEHGAVAQTIQDSTVTFSSSPYALAASFSGDTAETYDKYSNTIGRVGIAANFNLSDTSNPALNATRKQLNEWSATLRLGNDHSSRSKMAQKAFDDHLKPTLQILANNAGTIMSTALSGSNVLQATVNAVDAYLTANPNASESEQKQALADLIVQNVFNSLQSLNISLDNQQKIAVALQSFESQAKVYVTSSKALDDELAALAKLPSWSFIYNQQQPASGGNYSVLKLVYERQSANIMQLTANVSGSLYHHPDANKNQDTFRDFTAALQLQAKLGRSPFVRDAADKSQITMAFDGRYERLPENQGVPGKKADIAVAGGKFEIPVAAGVSFPISVTYANATELIKEAHVSGNFGITFDLDKLKALVSK